MISKETLNILNQRRRSEQEHIIDEYVFSERDRKILKRRLLDDISFEMLADEFQMLPVQVKRVYAKWFGTLFCACTDSTERKISTCN